MTYMREWTDPWGRSWKPYGPERFFSEEVRGTVSEVFSLQGAFVAAEVN